MSAGSSSREAWSHPLAACIVAKLESPWMKNEKEKAAYTLQRNERRGAFLFSLLYITRAWPRASYPLFRVQLQSERTDSICNDICCPRSVSMPHAIQVIHLNTGIIQPHSSSLTTFPLDIYPMHPPTQPHLNLGIKAIPPFSILLSFTWSLNFSNTSLPCHLAGTGR